MKNRQKLFEMIDILTNADRYNDTALLLLNIGIFIYLFYNKAKFNKRTMFGTIIINKLDIYRKFILI